MAKTKEDELISLGADFVVQAKDGNDEVRFRNAKSVSSALCRLNSANRNFKMGQRYELLARLVEDVPSPAMVSVEIPAEDVGTLPNTVVIKKADAGNSTGQDNAT